AQTRTGPGLALLARLRAARRLPRRLARAGLCLRARQLRAAEDRDALAAAERATGGHAGRRHAARLRLATCAESLAPGRPAPRIRASCTPSAPPWGRPSRTVAPMTPAPGRTRT